TMGRLLLLERQRGASVLRVVDLQQQNRVTWSLRVPLAAARLLVDGASNAWRLLDWNEAGDIVSAAGTVGDHEFREEGWRIAVADIDDLEALSISGRQVLALETQTRSALPRSGPFWRWAALVQPSLRTESRFWKVSQHGSSAFI